LRASFSVKEATSGAIHSVKTNCSKETRRVSAWRQENGVGSERGTHVVQEPHARKVGRPEAVHQPEEAGAERGVGERQERAGEDAVLEDLGVQRLAVGRLCEKG
jgi:hypothetical protein